MASYRVLGRSGPLGQGLTLAAAGRLSAVSGGTVEREEHAPPVFKRGTLFRHGKWLEPDLKTKALCRVTAIRHGQIYYGFGADARHGSYYKTAEGLLADGAEVLA